MKRREFLLSLAGLGLLAASETSTQRRLTRMGSELPRLKVFDDPNHPNHRRYLITEKGELFFYLGDTPHRGGRIITDWGFVG